MQAERAATADRSANNRTKFTNGSRRFLTADGRTLLGRRLVDIEASIISDLGGPGELSEAQRQLIRRAATLALRCEVAEGELAEGASMDITGYTATVNALRRLFATLGLRRRARTINLQDYIKQGNGG